MTWYGVYYTPEGWISHLILHATGSTTPVSQIQPNLNARQAYLLQKVKKILYL